MFNLLVAVEENVTKIVSYVSIGVIALLIVSLALICIFNKKYTTSEIAYAGVALAASFALSFVKFSPVQYGGSITLASFVPLLVYAYKFGIAKGGIAGLIFGLFNFISDPFILTPLTFALDYLLAFSGIALMGVAKYIKLNKYASISIGVLLVYAFRFTCHLLSGFIYFAEGAIWANIPAENMFLYSFIYQCVYIPADLVISLCVMLALIKTKTLDRLMEKV